MPKFKVELERPCPPKDGKPVNPFLGGITGTIEMSIRAWEVDADDEAEVRSFLDDAIKRDLPNVRGYRLRSITQIAP